MNIKLSSNDKNDEKTYWDQGADRVQVLLLKFEKYCKIIVTCYLHEPFVLLYSIFYLHIYLIQH